MGREGAAQTPVGEDYAARLREVQERKRQNAAAAERRLSQLYAEDQEERSERERRRQNDALLHRFSTSAPRTAAQNVEAKYWEMGGTLGAFRHAMNLHPHGRLAATGSALGSISIWSQWLGDSRPPGSAAEKRAATACGEQPWQIVDKVSSARSSAGKTDMVLALTFLPTPSPLPAGTDAPEVFLASASSDGTIKIWAGPPQPLGGDAPASQPAGGGAGAHGGGAASGSMLNQVAHHHAQGAEARDTAQAGGDRGGAKRGRDSKDERARVRLTLQPLPSGGDTGQMVDTDELHSLVTRDVAVGLGVPLSCVHTEVLENTQKACIIDIDFTTTSAHDDASAALEKRLYHGEAKESMTVQQLSAAQAKRAEAAGLPPDALGRSPATVVTASSEVQEKGTTELIAELLALSSDPHSLLRKSGQTQRIQKARIVFVLPSSNLGLKWERVGQVRPAQGRMLSHPELSKALTANSRLTRKQWEALRLDHLLRPDDFIKTQDFYLRPADDAWLKPAVVACANSSVPAFVSDASRSANATSSGAEGVGGDAQERRTPGGRESSSWRLLCSLVDHSSSWCASEEVAHSDEVSCLICRQAVPAQPMLVSAGDDKLIKVWSLVQVSGTRPRETKGGGGGGPGLEAGEEEEIVAAAALLGLRKGRWRCSALLHGHGGRILCLAIGGCGGRLLVSSDSLGEVLVWVDGGLTQRFHPSPQTGALVGGGAGRELPDGNWAVEAPLLQKQSQHTQKQSQHTMPRLRAVDFVLLDRFQESWPVRSMALGARSLYGDDMSVLMELSDSLSTTSAQILKVPLLLTLYSEYTRALTVQNCLPGLAH